MDYLVFQCALIMLAGLLLELLSTTVINLLRRHMVYARRHCLYGHSWGRRFLFKNGGLYYWGWRCRRCPLAKTQWCEEKDALAHKLSEVSLAP